ncbi:hypothetical protein D3C71_1747040 [compost metagenome]
MLDRTVAVAYLPFRLNHINFILKLIQSMAVKCRQRLEILNLSGEILTALPRLQIFDMHLQLIQRNLCTIVFFH